MPWKETCVMNEKRKFILDWLCGDWTMLALCEHFGISRKTGYKILGRFKVEGLLGLEARSKAPVRHPNETAEEIQLAVLAQRRKHPYWGPRKLRRRLQDLYPKVAWPAASTIGTLLKHKGLSRPRRRSRRVSIYSGPFDLGLEPNDVWGADFKGWFRTGDGLRIDPFTVSDLASRYLLLCRAVKRPDGENVQDHLTGLFREFGLPQALRTDNGSPFASLGAGGLSKLSIWLIKLGIRPERIRPGHPEENGIHERMHKTLKQETANPPKANESSQQRAFDRFVAEYNDERPHEGLEMKTPTQIYRTSERDFPSRLRELEYRSPMSVRRVSSNGTFKWRRKCVFIGNALVGETIGIMEEESGTCRAYFGQIYLGEFDQNEAGSTSVTGSRVLPMCPV
ncbi:MAG: IS481 family transposase [Elusimicrobia bacterium]|nr:MAG: IS481 family transposase [Elusimicrobiota bacterium]